MNHPFFQFYSSASKFFFKMLIFFAISNPCLSKSYDLKYDISHQIDRHGSPYLTVSLNISKDSLCNILDKNSFTLIFPDNWSSGKHLINNIKNIRSVNKEVRINHGLLPDEKVISFSDTTRIINVTYDVYSSKEVTLFQPMITADFFHFIGKTVFAYPAYSTSNDPLKINFHWDSHINTKKSVLMNSFGNAHHEQIVTLPLQKILHAAYAGGKYEKRLLKIDKNPVFILTHSISTENKEYLYKLIRKIITFQRDFWQDTNFPYYFITIISNDHIPLTFSGTHTTNAISLLVNETSPFLKEDLPFVLAHEHWHTWMGGKLKGCEGYKSLSWLFEGFTDYYAEQTALKSNAVSLEQVIDRYNRILKKHYLSPVREKPNSDLENYFDEDPLYVDLPYTRGNILAHELNTKIIQTTLNANSLDDVFKALFKRIKNFPNKSPDCLTYLDFKNIIRIYIKDAEAFFETHLDNGELISPLSNSFGECVSLIEKDIKPENYNFDLIKSLSNQKVIGLKKNSPIYTKGLRNGQKIIGYKFQNDDNKQLDLEVMVGKQRKHFSLSREGNPISIPQYQLDLEKYKKTPELCMRFLNE